MKQSHVSGTKLRPFVTLNRSTGLKAHLGRSGRPDVAAVPAWIDTKERQDDSTEDQNLLLFYALKIFICMVVSIKTLKYQQVIVILWNFQSRAEMKPRQN